MKLKSVLLVSVVVVLLAAACAPAAAEVVATEDPNQQPLRSRNPLKSQWPK